MMTTMKIPHGTRLALQISMPVSVMVSICCLSVIMSMPASSCVWDIFFREDWEIWWTKLLTLFILPIPAMLSTWVIMVAYYTDRVVDIGIIILTLSSLRLLDNISVPSILSCSALAMLLSVRLYNHIYPKTD
jgi:hypothetical protein